MKVFEARIKIINAEEWLETAMSRLQKADFMLISKLFIKRKRRHMKPIYSIFPLSPIPWLFFSIFSNCIEVGAGGEGADRGLLRTCTFVSMPSNFFSRSYFIYAIFASLCLNAVNIHTPDNGDGGHKQLISNGGRYKPGINRLLPKEIRSR
jgi:hypothetical protein